VTAGALSFAVLQHERLKVPPVRLDRGERQHAEAFRQRLPHPLVRAEREEAGLRMPVLQETLPLAGLERLLHPAVVVSGGGGPVRLAETGHDPVVILHEPDRTGTSAGPSVTARVVHDHGGGGDRRRH
jgi:hypothetical protein